MCTRMGQSTTCIFLKIIKIRTSLFFLLTNEKNSLPCTTIIITTIITTTIVIIITTINITAINIVTLIINTTIITKPLLSPPTSSPSLQLSSPSPLYLTCHPGNFPCVHCFSNSFDRFVKSYCMNK